jgi:hypothetical protein
MTRPDNLCVYVRAALYCGHVPLGVVIELRHDPALHIPGVGARDVVTITERHDLRGRV